MEKTVLVDVMTQGQIVEFCEAVSERLAAVRNAVLGGDEVETHRFTATTREALDDAVPGWRDGSVVVVVAEEDDQVGFTYADGHGIPEPVWLNRSLIVGDPQVSWAAVLRRD